jgi:polyisoprenoid-binding protein YceI
MKAAALLLVALLLPLSAHAASWRMDPSPSTLGFTGDFQGEAFHGRFKQFDVLIRYDPAHLHSARFDVSVKLGSVDTQNPERDQTLTGGDFFAVQRFPVAHFVTSAFHRAADGKVTADGTLDLHGIKQPVTLRVTFEPHGDHATLIVDTTLDRLAFKLGTPSDWDGINKRIKVHARLRLQRAP